VKFPGEITEKGVAREISAIRNGSILLAGGIGTILG
jgi:hypothetical protein